MPVTPRLVVFHPLDPRGTKIGGIETHVRLILDHHPPTMAVVLVGADEIGDLELGRAVRLPCGARTILFLPVLRVDPATINTAARRITRSLTFRYVMATLGRLRAVHRAVGGSAAASCEIGRFEFAVLPVLLGCRRVLTVHNEGRRGDAMDSLVKRWWWLHRLNERVALRVADIVFAVNASIAGRIAGLSPRYAARTRVLSVSVDTRRFAPSPFTAEDEVLRVCFAGRLDAFKDPPLMFATLALAAERIAARPVGRFRRLAFLYGGASDPAAVAGFDRLSQSIEHRGILDAAGVATLMRDSHIGLITSVFEGLPCYLLEMLASGRPVVARALPQFEGLIADGVSGRLVPDGPDGARADALADALVAVAGEIAADRLDPQAIAGKVGTRSIEAQMGRLFRAHAELQDGRSPRDAAGHGLAS